MKQKRSDSKPRQLFSRMSDRVILIVLAVMAALTAALWIMRQCGLMPIEGGIMIYLPLMMLFVLVGWGAYALIRRISNKTAKVLVGVGVCLVLVLALMLVFTYAAYMSFYLAPQKYATMTSPSGDRQLVVLRTFDNDEARSEERKAARLAADPEGDPELTIQDWGYSYKAYPKALGWFYRASADVEGEVILTVDDFVPDSEDGSAEAPALEHGTLMVEWLDDGNTAHFYVENPGVAEGGDCYLRF